MFYIEQVFGKQADASHEFFKARHAGATIYELEKIYSDATGKDFPAIATKPDDCWVLYNAPDVIRSHYVMPKSKMEWYFKIWTRSQYEKWAQMVGEKCGGTWQVVEEY